MPTVYKINHSKIDIQYLMPTVYKINHSKIDIQYLMPTIYKINQSKIDMLRNGGKGEASPSLFPRFAPNTHIYLYASTVHMYCNYPAILKRK